MYDRTGIRHRKTTCKRPEQNGVAERMNRTLAEGMTAMLTEAKLPVSFWAYALHTFQHVHNQSPTSSVPGSTPFERWFKRKPEVDNLRIFGSLAYVHIQKDQRSGLHSHYRKCIFLGYPPDYKGWLFWDPANRKELVSSTAVFDERVFPGNSVAAIPDLTLSVERSTPDLAPDLPDNEDSDDPGGEDLRAAIGWYAEKRPKGTQRLLSNG